MVLWATILVLHGATLAGSMPSGGGGPENITVMFLSPSEVRVSWTTSPGLVEKYDVMYKPTDASYRVVVVVAGNSDSVTLTGLKPNTQYQVVVTAVRAGKKYKSRPVVFLTQDMPKPPQEPTVQITGEPPAKVHQVPPDPNLSPPYIQVRGVEVGIVCLVLVVWVGAIILFFNRWGKIRMLLPYQPDYKDTQLKVPGSCQQGNSCQNPGSSGLCCSQTNGITEVQVEDRHISASDGTRFIGSCCEETEEEEIEGRQRRRRRRRRRNFCCACWPSPRERDLPPHPRDCNCRFALLHRAEP